MKKISKNIKNKTWFRLDNAGTVFPGQNTRTWSNVIRASINLKEDVDPELLFESVKKCLPRFPTMAVRLRNGFFWHYIEKNPEAPVVVPDANNPCMRIKYNENRFDRTWNHGKAHGQKYTKGRFSGPARQRPESGGC